MILLAVACDAGERGHTPRDWPVPLSFPDEPTTVEFEPMPAVQTAPSLDGATWTLAMHYLGSTDDLLFAYDRSTHRFVTFDLASGKTRSRAITNAPSGSPTGVQATADGFLFEWDRTAVYARSTRDAVAVAWTGPTGIAPVGMIDDLVIGKSADRVQALALADGSPRWQRPCDETARILIDKPRLGITRLGANRQDHVLDLVDPRTGVDQLPVLVPNDGWMQYDLGPEGIAMVEYGAAVIDRSWHIHWLMGHTIGPGDTPVVIGPRAYFIHRHGDEHSRLATIFAVNFAGPTRPWTTTVALSDSATGQPTMAESPTLAFVASGYKVTAIDRATGVPKWEHTFDFQPTGIFASHDTLVAINDDKTVGFPFASRAPTPPRR